MNRLAISIVAALTGRRPSLRIIPNARSGWRQTKAEFLASIRSGELKYHTFAMHGVRMRLYGNTVVAAGEASAKGKTKGPGNRRKPAVRRGVHQTGRALANGCYGGVKIARI